MAPASNPSAPSWFVRLQRITLRDVSDLAPTMLLLCRVAWQIRRRSFLEVLERFGLNDALTAAEPARVARAEQLVRWAHHVVPIAPNCLLDSLAVAALVRRQGFSVPVCIGVKLEQGSFRAHAWLGDERSPAAEGFRPLYRLPHAS